MSQQYINLATVLVEQNCGRLASKIFAVVAQYGGLGTSLIARYTNTSPKRLKLTLSIMLQQRLLLYRTDPMLNDVYYIDPDSAHEFLRTHRLAAIVRERYGEAPSRLILHLRSVGQASVDELTKTLCVDAQSKLDGKAECNGGSETRKDGEHSEDEANEDDDSVKPIFTTTSELHSSLRSLLRDDYLAKVGRHSFTPTADLEIAMHGLVGGKGLNIKMSKSKKQTEDENAVRDLKRRWMDQEEYDDTRDVEFLRPSKRTKLNGGIAKNMEHDSTDQTTETGPRVSASLVVRVSFVRCKQHLQRGYQTRLAEKYLGNVTAAVYDALLQTLGNKIKLQHTSTLGATKTEEIPEEPPTASTQEISKLLDTSLDLASYFAGASYKHKINGDGKATKKVRLNNGSDFTDIGIKNEHESDSEEDNQSNTLTAFQERNQLLSLVDEHLRLLEEHPKRFCKRVVGGGRGEWGVDHEALADTIEKTEVDNIILSRFGKVQMRLVRMLRDKGKLDEKQVAAYSMMRVKDVRAVMTELKYAGFVDAPEVPKDAHRFAQRSIYLWGHQQDGVRELILQHCYDGIAHLLRRLQGERRAHRGIMEKAELMRDRQNALSQSEREMIEKARRIEAKLSAQVQRIDELVAVMT